MARIIEAGLLSPEKSALEVAFLAGEKPVTGEGRERVGGMVLQVRVGKRSGPWENREHLPTTPPSPSSDLSLELSEPDLSLGHSDHSH